MSKIKSFTMVCLITAMVSDSLTEGKVTTSLQKILHLQPNANIIIRFNQSVASVYNKINGLQFVTQAERMTSLRSALLANSKSTQSRALQVLLKKAKKDVIYQRYWISNSISVRNADAALIQELSQLQEVSEIREMIKFPISSVVRHTQGSLNDGPQWGMEKILASNIWTTGLTGQGIVVANIDTGVLGSHTVLAPNFLGEYGWFDPRGRSPVPVDSNGHGTHTMGTLAGQNGYGVAPGAKWMACRECFGDSCFEDDLLACGEFITCPTHPDGSNGDCSKAPHVVSNSWGSQFGGQTFYDDVIAAWKFAGIIPVFSAGNEGPLCSSLRSPGDRPGVIGVAATDMADAQAIFSSQGPPIGTLEQKPELSAPGAFVKSAFNEGDDSYETLSGTSMACPHVAGAVALLLAGHRTQVGNYERVRQALLDGADTKGLKAFGLNCGNISDTDFPNFKFGYGRLNVHVSLILLYDL